MDATTMRTYVRVMGLVWTESLAGRGWEGADADGRRYASVTACTRGFEVHIEAHGCGHGGLWLGGAPIYPTAERAMEATDRHVVAYIDGRPPEPHRPRAQPPADDDGRSAAATAGWSHSHWA
jgi:hypothetical protein